MGSLGRPLVSSEDVVVRTHSASARGHVRSHSRRFGPRVSGIIYLNICSFNFLALPNSFSTFFHYGVIIASFFINDDSWPASLTRVAHTHAGGRGSVQVCEPHTHTIRGPITR